MLKLRFEPGENLDRHRDAAARNLSKLFEKAVDEGYLRIWSYPRLDSLISGAVLYAVASSLGIKPLFKSTIYPPEKIDIPTILLGFPAIDYGTGEVDKPLFAISPKIATSPPPDTVYLDGDGSTPALLTLVLLGMGSIFTRTEYLTLLLSAMYAGESVDLRGRFYGIDAHVIDKLMTSDKLSLEPLTVLKSYLPHEYPLCKSISITVNPYYPSFTGNEEECIKVLQTSGLSNYVEKTQDTIGRKELEKIAVTILSRIKELLLVNELDASYYLGSIMVSRNNEVSIRDYRMTADAILYSIESSSSLEPLLSISLSLNYEYKIIENNIIRYSSILASQVGNLRPKKIKQIPWARTYLIDVDTPLSLTLLWRALTLLRRIERDSILVIEYNDGLFASSLQVEDALGYGSLKKLSDAKAISGDGLLVEISREK